MYVVISSLQVIARSSLHINSETEVINAVARSVLHLDRLKGFPLFFLSKKQSQYIDQMVSPAQWIDSRGFPSFFKTQSQHIDQMVAGGVLEERGGGEQQGLQGKASGSAISHQVETKSD